MSSSSQPDLIQRLSFSHLAELLELPDETQRRFCKKPCLTGWIMVPPHKNMTPIHH